MIQIDMKVMEDGDNVYTFEANNTDYEIMNTPGNPIYWVWSKRKSLTGRTTPKPYTLDQLAKRSKALANFVKLIEA